MPRHQSKIHYGAYKLIIADFIQIKNLFYMSTQGILTNHCYKCIITEESKRFFYIDLALYNSYLSKG